jgi:molybdopterin converting factor small subunit
MTVSSNSATAAQIRVPSMLRPTVGGERIVSAKGSTLRELIGNVDAVHPGFGSQLIDPATGQQRRFVNIYVNDDDVRYLDGLDTAVAPGDVISILPAVAGGSD